MSFTFSPRYNFFLVFFKFPTRLAFGVEQNISRKWENHMSESKETSERRDDVSLWYIFSLSIPLWKVFLYWIQTPITIFPVLERSHPSKVVGVELDLKIILDDNLSSRPVSFFFKINQPNNDESQVLFLIIWLFQRNKTRLGTIEGEKVDATEKLVRLARIITSTLKRRDLIRMPQTF